MEPDDGTYSYHYGWQDATELAAAPGAALLGSPVAVGGDSAAVDLAAVGLLPPSLEEAARLADRIHSLRRRRRVSAAVPAAAGGGSCSALKIAVQRRALSARAVKAAATPPADAGAGALC